MFNKIKSSVSRASAAAGIATTLASVPLVKDGTPNLTKQYADYSKQVRLEETRRKISRDISKTPTPTMALDKRGSRKLRKP